MRTLAFLASSWGSRMPLSCRRHFMAVSAAFYSVQLSLPEAPSIRTRFAPSPTGDLHLGSLRTALFNYLMAKRHNGQFILRIEDTDRVCSKSFSTALIPQNRLQENAIGEICKWLKWVGINWDEGIPWASYQLTLLQVPRLEAARAHICRWLRSVSLTYV